MMVFFASGGAAISPRAANTLRQFVRIYREEFPTYRMFVAIEGHASEEGGPAQVDRVAEMRARAVRHFLLGEGLPYDRLQIWTCGDREPLVRSPARDPQNQRAVVRGTGLDPPQKQRSDGCRLIE
jgi:outer membrane protein OmpA-like peptidoglycan-associated protein